MRLLPTVSLQQSKRGIAPVVGVILMVAVTVILASLVGTFVLGTAAQLEEKDDSQSSEVRADATFEQVETDNGEKHVTATLVEASHDAYEVRLVADTATDDETEKWTKPADDAYYEESRTVGDDLNSGLHEGDTVLLRVYDGEQTHTVETFVVE